MPRDSRLYMTFPNDFWTHHKVAPLSDAAFRAFVEMNGYSRMHDLDGVIPGRFAEFKWGEALDELVASDATKPLVLLDAATDTFIIRDYAEHQQTTAARKALVEAKSIAGAIGAAKRWHGKTAAEPMAKDSQSTETETYISSPNGEESPRKRAHTIPSTFTISDRMRVWAADQVPLVDIDAKLPEFIDYWQGVGKTMKDWEATWRNGMRKQQGFAERDRGSTKTRTEQNMAVVAEIAAREATELRGIGS